MNIDAIPVNWTALFQVASLVSIALIMVQVKMADILDHMRHPREESGILFRIRRWSMWAKALALCWSVIYGHEHAWMPWPPLISFLIAFDVYVITHIFVLNDDIRKRRAIEELRRLGQIAR